MERENEEAVVTNSWNQFLKNHCVYDEHAYMSCTELTSIFAYHLSLSLGVEIDCFQLAHKYLEKLLNKSNFVLSPGRVIQEQFIDTRLVFCMKIIPFRKKAA